MPAKYRPALLSFSLFLLLSLLVALGSIGPGDNWLMALSWPSAFEIFLPLAAPIPSLLFLSLIALLLFTRGGFVPALLFVALFLITLILEIIGKTIITTDPPALYAPFAFMEGTYPSGHMLRITLFAGLLAYLAGRKIFWLLLPLQALAMLAVQGHTVSDLLGGFLLGLSAYFLFLAQYQKKRSPI